MASRGTFDDVVLDDGRTMKLPSGWFEIDGERFLWTKSAVSAQGRIDVGITVVENWAKECRK